MRLIDADELMEHVWRDKLDSRELIAKMIETAPTIKEISIKIPIVCNYTDEEIAKSFIKNVEAVKDLLPEAESEDKCKKCKYYLNPDYTRCHECYEKRRFKEFSIKELHLLREALECKEFWNLSGEVNREITLREKEKNR